MGKAVVVDSDVIYAIYNPNDPLNSKATQTFESLVTQGYQLIYPSSVIFEVISLFQRVLPTPTVTNTLLEMIKDDSIFVYIIDSELLKDSVSLFNPTGSKKNTLIDCSVACLAKKIKADAVLSFDHFYTRQGLKLAADLVKGKI